PSLVDALEHGHGVTRGLFGDLLKTQGGAMKQLQRSGDTLEEMRGIPLRCFVSRPEHGSNLGHGREAVLNRGRITLRLVRVTPRPIDTEAPSARRGLSRYLILVIGAGRQSLCAHG